MSGFFVIYLKPKTHFVAPIHFLCIKIIINNALKSEFDKLSLLCEK